MSILCNFRAVAVGVGGFLLSLPQIVAGPTASDFLAAFSQAGSHFEVNRGQLPADVAYTFRSTDYRIDLVPHGMNLALPENAVRLGDPMQVRFAGSDGTGELTGEEALPFSVMHRVPDGQGRSRMTSVSTFSRVKEVSLYEGIDLYYSVNSGRVEYDLHVAPGANPSSIGIEAPGAEQVALDDEGNIHIRYPIGEVVHQRPIIFQDIEGRRVTVDGRYRLQDERISIEVAQYDASLPLVIDPVISVHLDEAPVD